MVITDKTNIQLTDVVHDFAFLRRPQFEIVLIAEKRRIAIPLMKETQRNEKPNTGYGTVKRCNVAAA
jgi:hypothetical protein